MIVDFHTHVFPDRIAEKTIDLLAKKANIKAYGNGTVSDLYEKIVQAGVNFAVTLPVLTKPEQFDSVLNFALFIKENYSTGNNQLIPFAGIHPACDDIEGKMKLIKEKGFKGVKIHPDYQNTFFDDEGYIKILNSAKENDLIVLTHAGIDGGYRDVPTKCPPALASKVIDKVKWNKLILAHLGETENHKQIFEFLAGKDVYLDTAFVLKYISKEDFVRLCDIHGDDKILFATDSPWKDIKEDVEVLKNFNLPKETQDKIFYKNAFNLLGIKENYD